MGLLSWFTKEKIVKEEEPVELQDSEGNKVPLDDNGMVQVQPEQHSASWTIGNAGRMTMEDLRRHAQSINLQQSSARAQDLIDVLRQEGRRAVMQRSGEQEQTAELSAETVKKMAEEQRKKILDGVVRNIYRDIKDKALQGYNSYYISVGPGYRDAVAAELQAKGYKVELSGFDAIKVLW